LRRNRHAPRGGGSRDRRLSLGRGEEPVPTSRRQSV